MWLATLFPALLLVRFSESAKILAIVPSPAFSHQNSFYKIWRELLQRGHQITLLTTDPMRDMELTNLTEIDLRSIYKVKEDNIKNLDSLNPLSTIKVFQHAMNQFSFETMNHPEVQYLLKNDTNFDLLMAESFYPEFLAFAEFYKCPKILITSMEPLSCIHTALGNPAHPVVNPEFTLPFYGQLTFSERLVSTLYQLYVNYFRSTVSFPLRHENMKKYFGESLPSISEMLSNVDMQFVNVNPMVQNIRALGPSTITYGGGFHLRPAGVLDKDLKNFLDNAKEGVIYFSLGSHMQVNALNEEKLKAITETFRELPYKILCKYESEELENKSDNVKLVKWAPQQDVLRHPNIKLFITQGGLQSVEEAIFSLVPMVILPVIGDQFQNAKRMQQKGLAKIVEHKITLKKEDFKAAILEVIENPKYKENVRKSAELALDQPMTGMEKVIWWTEYVIRHKGAQYLKNPMADLPWYQYLLLDVAACVAIVLTILLIVVLFLLKKVIGIFDKLLRRNKEKIL